MKKSKPILLRGGVVVTMNAKRDILKHDILIENGKIARIAKSIRASAKSVQIVELENQLVIPGLIQNHVHLCQVLFRGEADDLDLLHWLSKKIWPMEKNHTARSIQASAQIAILEMQRCGTTSILDMGTVHHTDAMLDAVAETGIRYWGGKCLMDDPDYSGPLGESTAEALKETEYLIQRWGHGARAPLINYALCPRFAVSCTDAIMRACADLQQKHDLIIHTHASESLDEIELVRKKTGMGNIEYFNHLKILNPKTVVVHGVHMSAPDIELMRATKTPLVHCPSSNLKLGSGIAPVHRYCECGLTVGLGADGAPCNNTMDLFKEIHLAALLQKPRFGPQAMPAEQAFAMATIDGARVLGQDTNIGSLEEGKCADIVIVDRSHPGVATVENPYSALVYSCSGRDVSYTMTAGVWNVFKGVCRWGDEALIIARAKKEKGALIKRIKKMDEFSPSPC